MDKKEIWKDVKGYEGKYLVSNYGRVKSMDYRGMQKEHLIVPSFNSNGYLIIGLSKDGKRKTVRINRLVYETFIGDLPQWIATDDGEHRMEVNHIDEDKTNNCLWNLELVTHKQNVNHGSNKNRISKAMINNVLNSTPVYQYTPDLKLVKIYPSQAECKRYGYNQANISACCNGKIKSHKGFIWSFRPLDDK